LFSGLKVRVRRDYLIGPHTTFKIGGPAEYFVSVGDVETACELIRRIREQEVKMRVIGSGSNIIVDDRGLRGVVLSLSSADMREIYIREGMIETGAGVKLRTLLKETSELGLSGLEPLAGIPGTAGGAVLMNAGTPERTIGDAVHSVTCVSGDGRLETLSKGQCGFGYRTSALGDKIILSALIRLAEEDRKVIVAEMSRSLADKKKTQPLGSLSAGCIFKNPPGEKRAGQLIQQAGLVGQRVGGAVVSAKHANFIINRGGATFDDVMTLIEKIRGEVLDSFGVSLELEVKVWSDREL